jgi:hypothetical protein
MGRRTQPLSSVHAALDNCRLGRGTMDGNATPGVSGRPAPLRPGTCGLAARQSAAGPVECVCVPQMSERSNPANAAAIPTR